MPAERDTIFFNGRTDPMPETISPMDVVFFGSGAFGLPTLEALSKEHRVRAVVTQPDRPAGRGKKLTPNPIALWTAENLPEAELIKHPRVDDDEICAQIRGVRADTWVVIAFGQKLGPTLLDGKFAINLHASLLPRWRGAAPINHAILAGDTTTGNSVITLAERMDAGFVLGQNSTAIEPTETAGELHNRLSELGPQLVLEVLQKHAAESLEPIAQDEAGVALAGKLGRPDAAVDFSRPAEVCRCQINGLSPWPGCAVLFGGDSGGGVRVKLLRADSQQGVDTVLDTKPGTLTDAAAGLVQTGEGLLRLIEVLPAGKKPMKWAAFARGQQLEVGCPITPA